MHLQKLRQRDFPLAFAGTGGDSVGAAEGREEVCVSLLKRLDEIEELVNQISIPLAFADGLYGLRSHINFVRTRVKNAMPPAAEQPAG